jgi:hypothetical protein
MRSSLGPHSPDYDAHSAAILNVLNLDWRTFDRSLRTSATGRLHPFAVPSGNDRYLRTAAGWFRREAAIADRGRRVSIARSADIPAGDRASGSVA